MSNQEYTYNDRKGKCKSIMYELDEYRPLPPDPEADNSFLERMPALENAERAYLQACKELDEYLESEKVRIWGEAEKLTKKIEAYRKYAEEVKARLAATKEVKP
mgnify:CR=1 FL=1